MKIVIEGDSQKECEIENIGGIVYIDIRDPRNESSLSIELPFGEFDKAIAAYVAAERANM